MAKKVVSSKEPRLHVMSNKKMLLAICQAWETKSPNEIAAELSTPAVPVTGATVSYIVNVLRSKGVYVPHKRKNGVYQLLVEDFLIEHPEFSKEKHPEIKRKGRK